VSDATCTIDGEFGIYRVAELKPQILALVVDVDEPALDLGNVTEMDAAGLQLLLFARREARARGKSLHLTRVSPIVQDVLQVAGMSADAFEEAAA
jgi:anti-sigma B factor antagonist